MVHALLKALRREASRRQPLRFQRPLQVFYAQPLSDHESWRAILEQVVRTFKTTTTKSLNLEPNHEMYQQVEKLVPWQLTRVQLAKPTLRRMPQDIGYTHRGASLLYADGSIEIESEDLGTIEFPKQRFRQTVAAAVFFYGYAEDDENTKEVSQAAPEQHVPGLRTDVSFPGLPPQISRELQASIARLHINAGHPSKQEMTRLFTMHGNITSDVLSCLEHLQCGTCKRTSLPQHPRPAAVPVMAGQFGDRLQIDRFWIRDLRGDNHCFLGVVDLATAYQQAGRVVGHGALEHYEVLRQIWLQPFGHPLVIEGDDDTRFAGEFKEMVEGAGTHLLIIPAEAHWRIGTIERKNAVLRSVAEKMIDEYAVTSGEHLDYIMVSATQAINSSTSSKGRTPYQAVFGKLARFPGDLLGDERALLANRDFTFAEEMRASALRIISEMRASHVIRRALLRKTAPSRKQAQEVLPGALAAYWRWSKKAKGRKRGGYILGRLLHHYPDGKTAWVHNGNNVVQVTYEQLRPAFGIESWSPAAEDIELLKDGAARLSRDLWDDERGPGPPPDESMEPELNIEVNPTIHAIPADDLIMPLVDNSGPAPATPATAPGTVNLPPLPPTTNAPAEQQAYSPTFNQHNTQHNTQNIYQHFGPSRDSRTRHASSQPYQHTRHRTTQRATQLHASATAQPTSTPPPQTLTEAEVGDMVPRTPPDIDMQIQQTIDLTQDEHVPASTTPHLTTDDYMTLMTDHDNGRLQQIMLPCDGWDGSPPVSLPHQSIGFRVMAAQALNEPVSSDSSDDDARATVRTRLPVAPRAQSHRQGDTCQTHHGHET